jgi:hypothetical protein
MAADPVAGVSTHEWDVFISYASEDAGWVRGELYPALRALYTRNGGHPSIFVDIEREGIPPGTNWMDFLAHAVSHSRYFVAVYSSHYFRKEVCDLEITWALQLNPKGTGAIVPIVLDNAAAADVPFKLSQISWLRVSTLSWFDRLREHLGLIVDKRHTVLRMSPLPDQVVVNNTLPPVRVEVLDQETGEPVPDTGPVTIRAEPPSAGLRGSLVSLADGGVACFDDLSLSTADPADPAVRLVAEIPSGTSANGPFFTVVEPAPVPAAAASPTENRLLVGEHARLRFTPNGQALVVVDGTDLDVHTVGGTQLSHTTLAAPARLWAAGRTCIAVADWSGQVVVVRPDGTTRTCQLGDASTGLSVPGSMVFAGDRLHVGMWSGAVWQVDPAAPAPTRVLHHPGGVQALTAVGEQLVFVDLRGYLWRRTPDGDVVRVDDRAVDRVVLDLWAAEDCMVVIGDDQVYRVSIDPPEVDAARLPVSAVTSGATGTSGLIVGTDGRGLRFDPHLTIHGAFRVVPGAELADLDQAGEAAVFAYPDGCHALVMSDRVVFTNTAGPVAVSPDGTRVAIAHASGVRFASVRELIS